MFEAIWTFLSSFGISGLWVLVIITAIITAVAVPLVLLGSKWLGLRVRIGRSITIEKACSGRPEVTEAVSPIKKKTHRDCPLYTDVILIIEATQEHTAEVCSLTMKERTTDQMRSVEQHLDILFASWALFICKQIEKMGVPPTSVLHKDVELMMELISCVISEKIRSRFHDLISTEPIDTKSLQDWDRLKRTYTHLISADIKKMWSTLAPNWLLTTLSQAIKGDDTTAPIYLLDIMTNKTIESELRDTLETVLESVRTLALAYRSKESEKYQEFVAKLRKIVNCEYVVDYALLPAITPELK